MSLQDWYAGLFAAIDAMDANAFADYMTEDGIFRYGSNPPAEGKPAVRDAVAGFFSTLNGLSHELLGTWEADDVRFIQGIVTYELTDGRSVLVHFLNLFRMEGDLVREYLVYTDPSPMAPPA